ncbi:MAG TPA: Rv1355c family protein [Myxococcaceae bacterium]|jgi:molybdopterin/thiamine biosynthesis adenylyltransferase
MDLLEALASARRPAEAFAPFRFSAGKAADRAAMARLLKEGLVTAAFDTLDAQVEELLSAEDPAGRRSPQEKQDRRRELMDGATLDEWGSWFFYPWSGRLVHLLPKEAFAALRSDRNRYKITPTQQALLATFRVGVVGLSVGAATALALAMEGPYGELRLADPDTLGLSNLNRLRASVHDLGVNKAVLAARAISEIDPYQKLTVLKEGLSESSIERFFLDGGALHLVIEECDDLRMKLQVRHRARALSIPVVMETSDRGLLDVERFDREDRRPLLHGLLEGVTPDSLEKLNPAERVAEVVKLLGPSQLSAEAAASILEMKVSLSSWPQLASSVALGAGVAADTTRRILLGEQVPSGRFRLDPSVLLRPQKAELVASRLAPEPSSASQKAQEQPTRPPDPAGVWPAAWRALIGWATLAPSEGNRQPWRFHAIGRKARATVEGGAEPWVRRADLVSLGAAVETAVLAAPSLYLGCEVESVDPGGVFLVLGEGDEPKGRGGELITRRRTVRAAVSGDALSAAEQAALQAACGQGMARTVMVAARAAVEKLAPALAAAERAELLISPLQRRRADDLRWSAQAAARMDGMEVAAMGLSTPELVQLSLWARPGAPGLLSEIGGGRAVEEMARQRLVASAALGAVLAEPTAEGAVEAGRELVRLWLKATELGLGLHPLGALPGLLCWLESEHTPVSRVVNDLASRARETRGALGALGSEAVHVVFRLIHAPIPSLHSLRHPVDRMLAIEPG